MKDFLQRYYRPFVGITWFLLWINLFVQYSGDTTFMEAFLAATCFLILAFPFTNYLSNKALVEAIRRRKIKKLILQFFIISFTIGILVTGMVNFFIYLEVRGFFNGGRLFVDFGPLLYQAYNVTLACFFINFGFCGIRFFAENIRLRQELNDTQIQILSGQVNPHFMFNVLNHIHTLMQKDVRLSSELLLQYSDVLRYQLYSGREEYVTLDREVDFLKNYVEVEKMRWKGKLDVVTSWTVRDEKAWIRPLIFVTFIENAFKHVYRPDNGKGMVTVSLEQEGRYIRFRIENSFYPGPIPLKVDSGIGLGNARKRLDILYPGKYELEITQSDSLFTCNLIIDLSVK